MSTRRTPGSLLALALALTLLAPVGSAEASSAARAPREVTARSAATATVGQPPSNYVMPATSYFSFPNRSKAEKFAIRNPVLATVRSVWGGPRTSDGLATAGNGTIRIATWSFNDWDMAKALYFAHTRGVSVQVVAAQSANEEHAPWKWLKDKLGQRLEISGRPETRDLMSFARECRGSCRGHGGTAHAKYFLFDNVGASRIRDVVVQSSMNLTKMGFQGQWNQAYVSWNATIYDQFKFIYDQTRIGNPVAPSYRSFTAGGVTSRFFPFPSGTSRTDPVMQILSRTGCKGATAGGNAKRRTKIRVIQYSIYGDRGTWLAKRLRALWNAGCDIKIIYSVSSRPVISILRSRAGRGAIPMRQSVITNSNREIVKYNHSKWMTVTGVWGGSRAAFLTFTGSANWSPFALTGDEQMQQILSRGQATRHNANFTKTWRQRTSHAPGYGVKAIEARMMTGIPEEPTFGQGIYKYLSPYGE